MKKLIIILIVFFAGKYLSAQDVICSANDKVKLDSIFSKARKGTWNQLRNGLIMYKVAMEFEGVPYVAHTLEMKGGEKLVVNFGGLDCTTFVESTLAISICIKKNLFTYEQYLKELEVIRYRNGVRNGYASRLHYLSEWIRDNSGKGYLRDVTNDVKGIQYNKTLNFMSTHRDSYPALKDDSIYSQIQIVEDTINNYRMRYVPVRILENTYRALQFGDIVAITTTINGLDVVHVGLAVYQDGKLHLMHASSDQGKVVISELPLVDYLKSHKIQTGVIVARFNYRP